MYNAFYDEKQERKVFEKRMKDVLKNENDKIQMKITTINETLTSHIDTKFKTLEDEVLQSVAGLNDSITSITNLTSIVTQNENSISHLQLETEQHKTALIKHDSLVNELNGSCQDKGNVDIIELLSCRCT